MIRTSLGALCAAGLLALVAACGGGGGDGDGPGAGPSSYAQGPITGFGSIIVNGVRWDDSNATVSDDDGNRTPNALKLGMVVEVDGSKSGTASGTATAIRHGAQTVGPVESVNAGAGTLVVLGQTVATTTSTVFDDGITGGLAGLAAADVVEVHGLFDATANQIVATRIEKKPNATEYRLRGSVSALTATTFSIGTAVINFATASLPTGFTLANGVQVKVRLATAPVNSQWVATRVRPIARALGGENRPEAEVEGTITIFSSAADFEINGLKVNAANAAFPDGQAGVALGVRVEVKGAVVDGVLVATSVKLDDERRGGDKRLFELHGSITSVDPATHSFVLRGVTVNVPGTVTWKDGLTEAALAANLKVEVKGTLSADRKSLDAQVIGKD